MHIRSPFCKYKPIAYPLSLADDLLMVSLKRCSVFAAPNIWLSHISSVPTTLFSFGLAMQPVIVLDCTRQVPNTMHIRYVSNVIRLSFGSVHREPLATCNHLVRNAGHQACFYHHDSALSAHSIYAQAAIAYRYSPA